MKVLFAFAAASENVVWDISADFIIMRSGFICYKCIQAKTVRVMISNPLLI